MFGVIGKYIQPMRYRDTVETQNLNQLTSSEQKLLSEDQKHFCCRKSPLSIAAIALSCCHECLQSEGSGVDEDVHARFGISKSLQCQSIPPQARTDDPPTEHLHSQGELHHVLKFTSNKDCFLKKGMDRPDLHSGRLF